MANVRAAEELSGGWRVGARGFYTANKANAGDTVSIRVRKAGTGLGLFVTYSNNPKQNTPGKLWLRKDFGEQDTLTYVVGKDVAQSGEALAIRSSNKSGELAKAVQVERGPGNSFLLTYSDGRVLEVTVTRP